MTIPANLAATLFTRTTNTPVTGPSPTLSAPANAFFNGSTITAVSPQYENYIATGWQWFESSGIGETDFTPLTDNNDQPITVQVYQHPIDGSVDFDIYCQVTYTDSVTGETLTANTNTVSIISGHTLTATSSMTGPGSTMPVAPIGQQITITYTTLYAPDGTEQAYSIQGINSSDLDGASLTGIFTTVNNQASFTLTVTNSDLANNYFSIYLDSWAAGVQIEILSADTPVFLQTPVASSTNTSGTVRSGDILSVLPVSTVNAVTTTYQWIASAGPEGGTALIPGATSSTFTIPPGFYGVNIKCEVTISDSSGNGFQANTNSFATAEQFTISSTATTVAEGESVTITLQALDLDDGTTLPYTISGFQLTSADISGAPLTGNLSVLNESVSITLAIAQDNIFESAKTLTLTLDEDPTISVTVDIPGSPVTGLPVLNSTPTIQSNTSTVYDSSIISVPVDGINYSNISYDWKVEQYGSLVSFSSDSSIVPRNNSQWDTGRTQSLSCTVTISDDLGNEIISEVGPIIVTPTTYDATVTYNNQSNGTFNVTVDLTVNNTELTKVPFEIFGGIAGGTSMKSPTLGEFSLANGVGSVTLELTSPDVAFTSMVIDNQAGQNEVWLLGGVNGSLEPLENPVYTYELASHAAVAAANPDLDWHLNDPQLDVGMEITWNGAIALVTDWQPDGAGGNDVNLRISPVSQVPAPTPPQSSYSYDWISYGTLATANPDQGEGYPYIGGSGWHPYAPRYDVGVNFIWGGTPALVIAWRNDAPYQNSVYVRLG